MIITTMPDYPLTVRTIFDQGAKLYPNSQVITSLGDTKKQISFSEMALRVKSLAGALQNLGIKQGDCIGTLCWNIQEHLEIYFAVPAIGAILNALNPRFSLDQLVNIINQVENRIIIVDYSFIPLLEKIVEKLPSVEKIIVINSSVAGKANYFDYEELIANTPSENFVFPEIDEHSPASICFTSGTTGDPKGIVYSHRSEYLHIVMETSAAAMAFTERDRILMTAQMFHSNAWGMPYSAWLVGADIIFPGRSLEIGNLCRLIESEKITYSAGVPVIWNEIINYAEKNNIYLGSLREIMCGGSAPSRNLIERFKSNHQVKMIQVFGMVETGSAVVLSHPPKDTLGKDDLDWQAMTGKILPFSEFRIMDGDKELEWDGKSVGEIQIRGPFVTKGYLNNENSDSFQDDWLRTGDLGTINKQGYLQITDRTKDVIKSGGEWISSVALENALMSHPQVLQAAVIAIPDEKWSERPLACVVLKENEKVSPLELKNFLKDNFQKWWVPEKWAFLTEIPLTPTGKINKKLLREKFSSNQMEIVTAL